MADQPERPWWKDAIFYQIYPRSFQDSNGDGIGDIPGIISRLDEVASLGVTALWLSPLYCSPDADNGYDISDYQNIDPRYGTLEDFDNLVAAASQRGIRIVMDLVVNHTSDEHAWFQASRQRIEPYTDYYIWRPAGEDGQLPNNWTGFFMGPAWQWDDVRGEYYLHLFDPKQPDLNYHNPAVLDEVKVIMTFWLDRGVAGFRCDVINVLWKQSLDDGSGGPILRGLEHYKTQEGTHQILRELRRDVLDPRQAFTVGECAMVTIDEAKQLTSREPGELDLVIYFDHLEVDRLFSRYGPKPLRANVLLKRLTAWQRGLEWNAVYLENHDQPRIVSHYGDDRRYWARSAKLLAMLLLTLRGTPFIYQGQEIGMTNADFTSLDRLDDIESHNVDAMLARAKLPAGLRWWIIKSSSRDNARTPMQWDASPGAGFSTGTSWLPITKNAGWLNLAAQVDDPNSVLSFYKALIKLRGKTPALRDGEFEPVYSDRAVMVFRRTSPPGDVQPGCLIWLNMSGHTRSLRRAWRAAYRQANQSVSVHEPDAMCLASNTNRRRLGNLLFPWEAVITEEV